MFTPSLDWVHYYNYQKNNHNTTYSKVMFKCIRSRQDCGEKGVNA